jgi:hypothetical protein
LYLKNNRKFFSDRGKFKYKFNFQPINNNNLVSKKLSKYADSILSPLKKLESELEHRDVVYVTQQSQRWTVKEVDVKIN